MISDFDNFDSECKKRNKRYKKKIKSLHKNSIPFISRVICDPEETLDILNINLSKGCKSTCWPRIVKRRLHKFPHESPNSTTIHSEGKNI